MNRGMLPLARWLLLAALLFGVAAAQPDDAYLDRYDLAIGNLQRAVAALPGDAVLAREELDGAFSALLTLSREAAAGPLAAALEGVVERARTAIVNTSQDDLAVQAAVLEGGFQRLVFDAALRAAADGEVALARNRLVRLGSDLGMGPADIGTLADADHPVAHLRVDFEAGVAEVIETRLAVAQDLAETNVGGAYRALARAYGAFLLVQDSPRVVGSVNLRFVDAADALVEDRADDAAQALEEVRVHVADLGEAARTRQATAVTEPAPGPSQLPDAPTDVPAEPLAEVPPTEPAEAPDATEPPSPTDVPAVAEEPPADAPADEPPADVGLELGPDADDDTLALSEVDLAALRADIEQALREERLARLDADLAAAGVAADARAPLTEALLDAGFQRLAEAQDGVAAPITDALAALQRGEEDAARSALTNAAERYERFLSPVVRARFADVDADTRALLRQLATEQGLRASDVTVAAGQLDTARRALAGEPEAALQTGARQTLAFWNGLPRAIVLVVIGILALIPLVLLNLAFGGGNRNWQLVGVALFLLLLPVLFEGFVGVSILVAQYTSVDWLAWLALVPALSPFENTVAQVVWASTSLLAVVFAVRGLYGICAQFGLVGRRRKAPAGARATRGTRTGSATDSIDWDED